MKLVSWNVNSLRSAENKFLKFVEDEEPDIVMLQEVRAHPDQLSIFLQNIPNYRVHHNYSGRLGYGGTALYYKSSLRPDLLTAVTGQTILDNEGRTIVFGLNDLAIVNFYVPNGNRNEERLKYKLDFCDCAKSYLQKLITKYQSVVVGGDFNVAPTELDLYSPDTNKKHSGFLPEERDWFNSLCDLGLLDSFRLFTTEGGHYTWWHMRDPERKNNKGWRFDYFLVSNSLKDRVKRSEILKNVYGSDHCPILLEITG